MKEKKQERIRSWLRDIAADFIKTSANTSDLVTVTRAEISDDLKRADIYISAYPPEREKNTLTLLKKQEGELRKYAQARFKRKFLPAFEFRLERGDDQTLRVEELLEKIKTPFRAES